MKFGNQPDMCKCTPDQNPLLFPPNLLQLSLWSEFLTYGKIVN